LSLHGLQDRVFKHPREKPEKIALAHRRVADVVRTSGEQREQAERDAARQGSRSGP
jgi:hypothetical protein